ncbi:MAG: hypothetical protein NC131_09345 [Roseburia sp.]|nr:hypothetical protein [Roseburia sp.]
MKIPPIDLSSFIHLLKSEGKAELVAATKCKLGSLSLLHEWDNILSVMEKEVVPLLSKGCDAKSLIAPAQKIVKSTTALAALAAEVLSFVPGPIGIICSVALAIGCFSTGNIIGGLFELLGCIPGGKVAGKGASKLFPKIEKIMIEIVQSNQALRVLVETGSKQQELVVEFFKKYTPKSKPKTKTEVGYGYGPRTEFNSPKTGNMPSLDEAIKINMERESRTHIPVKTDYYYPESTNSIIYRLETNTGKSIL